MRFDQLLGRRAQITQSRRKPLVLDAPAPAPEEWVLRARELPGVRLDKVRALRESIAAGTYDVEAKVQSFLDRYQQNMPTFPAA